MNYAVIMAGGTGKRLWPLSREKRPKQVLKLFGGQTLLYRCFERLVTVFDPQNIFVLTNIACADLVRENLPDLPFDNVISEPVVRDTAGAVGLVSTVLAKYDADATVAVVTADQIIEPPEVLHQALKDALTFVDGHPDSMITFGVQPTSPSTLLGYIKCVHPSKQPGCDNEIYFVEAFREKPDERTARQYLDSGSYMWNSGMFVWKARTILANLRMFLPESTEPLKRIRLDWDGPNRQSTLEQWFPKLPKISIDYAVMEKAEKVHAIKLNCRWLDVGSFAALAEVIASDADKNVVVAGTSELLDCRNNIVVTEDKGHLVAAIGIEDIVIAHSEDVTLVCRIDHAHRLKELLDLVNRHGWQRYL